MSGVLTARRSYRKAEVATGPGGFEVRLDAQPLKTPRGAVMAVPARALAAAIAAEWDAQGERLDLARVPLTRIAGTALDLVPGQRAQIEAELAAYAETELLCHRADSPAELVRRQRTLWQPVLDWLCQRYDARLDVHVGLLPRPQPAAALAALAGALAAADDWHLAALAAAVHAAGSLAVGLALIEGRLTAAEAFEAAELDGTFQIEKWGEDAEATRRRAGVRAELETADRFVRLLEAG